MVSKRLFFIRKIPSYLTFMISWSEFARFSLSQKVQTLYQEGVFVTAIRYYNYKINLYLLHHRYVEVFYNHKKDCIEQVALLDTQHSRMKFYFDQIKLPLQGLAIAAPR